MARSGVSELSNLHHLLNFVYTMIYLRPLSSIGAGIMRLRVVLLLTSSLSDE